MTAAQLGRLAMRVEGDWWIAYYAKIGTMEGALELGRLRMVLAEIPAIKTATLEYYKGVMTAMVSGTIGAKLEWPTPEQPAPEHEKAGRA